MDEVSPLRALRLEAGLRVAELAGYIDYTPTHLSRVEHGRAVLSDVMAARLCSILTKHLGRVITAEMLIFEGPDPVRLLQATG